MNNQTSKTQIESNVSILKFHNSTDHYQKDSSEDIKVNNTQVSAVQSIRRLVVLVPNVDINEVQLAREVWEMALAPRIAVLLVSLCSDLSEESLIKRRLINLAALIRDPRIVVETHIEYGRNWVRGVKSVFVEGDVIVCHEEQSVGIKHTPLTEVLRAVRAPVWTLSGYHPTDLPSRSRWQSTVIFWGVAIAIMAGFFYLQVQVNQITDSVAKYVVLCLSALAEIGSLSIWNSILS